MTNWIRVALRLCEASLGSFGPSDSFAFCWGEWGMLGLVYKNTMTNYFELYTLRFPLKLENLRPHTRVTDCTADFLDVDLRVLAARSKATGVLGSQLNLLLRGWLPTDNVGALIIRIGFWGSLL